MTIRLMRAGEEAAVAALVAEVFGEFVAPLYGEEGRAEFARYIDPARIRERSHGREGALGDHLLLVAVEGDGPEALLGAMELRGCTHVSLLFVHGRRQRGGIGRALARQAAALARARGAKQLTVNASPNGVPAYESFGFRVTAAEQLLHGIRFVPMSLTLEEP